MDNNGLTKPYNYIFWNKDFLIQKNIVANLAAISYQDLTNQLIELDNKTQSGASEFNELVEICFRIVCRVPILVVEVDVPYIVRCRPNEPKEIFKHSSQLSYNPLKKKLIMVDLI